MIYIPKIVGPCNGSKKAIDIIYNLYERERKKTNPKRIVIYKEILHNKNIIEDLKNKKIECINSLQEIDKNTIVIIRAHGESEDTYNYLKENAIEYYDATCVNVLQIHDIIRQKYYQNYDIIIIGKKLKEGVYHPEVVGSNGWCQYNAKIISNLFEVDNLDIVKNNILVVCQTTFNENDALLIADKIKKIYHNKNIEFINTTCKGPKLIQKYALEIAKKCDYMVIIGGKNSHNTNELYKLCSEVTPSIKISNLGELYEWLNKTDINESTNIGITGGASVQEKEIQECRQLIEFYLFYKKEKAIIEKYINDYNKKFLDKKDNSIVQDAIKKFIKVNTSGKYLRSILLSLGYKIASGQNDDFYIPLAMACETFQTSILIHDDIIDNATKRRGMDTIPTVYKHQFKSKNGKKSNIVANSLGICIGDLGLYLANDIILKNYQHNANLCKILEYYNKVIVNTIKGEIIDVKLPYNLQYEKVKTCKESDIMEMYYLKTAWYTTIGPFCLGCLLADNNRIEIDEYEIIFKNLGVAFQIKDDIIGIYGDSNCIGKPTNSDISEFKQTILYSYVYNHKEKYLKNLHKFYGKANVTESDVEEVKKIFIESGALEYAREKMDHLFDESIKQIKKLNNLGKYQNILLGLINYLRIRQK
ncbi:MAG: hypothetical protein HFI86_03930 [Bacilli bacterium]|nr:hypothetical protein [Bacilli bacterium]